MNNEFYDRIITQSYDGVEVSYGIKEKGFSQESNQVIMILTGKGGNLYGESVNQPDLYLLLIQKILEQYHNNYKLVMIVDNPEEDRRLHTLDSVIEILKFVTGASFDKLKITLIGYSSGARVAGWDAGNYPNIEKLIIFNPLLQFNTHKYNECFEKLGNKKVYLYMGEKESSTMFLPMIKERENVHREVLLGQTHHIDSEIFINEIIVNVTK